jgi:hypothetical protein
MTTPTVGDTIGLDPSLLFAEGCDALDALAVWCLIQDLNAAIDCLPADKTYGHERAIFARAIDILADGE